MSTFAGALPQQFVMKCNNGSGDVVVCKDKKDLDAHKTQEYFRTMMQRTYGTLTGENHYTNILPAIIAEELLDSSTQPNGSRSLVDYKIWSFDGHPAYIVCYSHRHDRYYCEIGVYDNEWHEHRECLRYTKHYQPERQPIPRPICLKEMLEVASKLSKGFPQVRVDLYEVKGKVYFGELTFTSSGGYMAHFTDQFLKELGDKCLLPQ